MYFYFSSLFLKDLNDKRILRRINSMFYNKKILLSVNIKCLKSIKKLSAITESMILLTGSFNDLLMRIFLISFFGKHFNNDIYEKKKIIMTLTQLFIHLIE